MGSVGIIGGFGTGKTAFAANVARYDYDLGRPIIANFHLKTHPYTYFSTAEIVKYATENKELMKGATLILDEAYLAIDSRQNDLLNRVFSYFIMQLRKLEIDLYYTSQLFGMCDKRLRETVSFMVECDRDNESIYYAFVKGDRRVVVPVNFEWLKSSGFLDLYDHKEIIDTTTKSTIEEVNILDEYKKHKGDERWRSLKVNDAVIILKASNPMLTVDQAKTVFGMLRNPDIAEIIKEKFLGGRKVEAAG